MFTEELDKVRLEALESKELLLASERKNDVLAADLRFANQAKENAVKQSSLLAEDCMKMKATVSKLQARVDALSLVEQENSEIKNKNKALESEKSKVEVDLIDLQNAYADLERDNAAILAVNKDLQSQHAPILELAKLCGVLVNALRGIEEEVTKAKVG